jgi:hypothetical protein
MHHQVSASAHVDEGIESFLNKDNYLVTSAQKDSSIEALYQTYFFKIWSCNIKCYCSRCIGNRVQPIKTHH